MKNVDFVTVKDNLTKREYAQPLVELVAQYPEKEGRKTFEYQFKKQSPSKIAVPVNLLSNLQFAQDDDGKFYLVIDGSIIERVVENGFKRIQLSAAYRPTTSSPKGSVE